MANEYTKFWKELLRFGNNEDERRKNWNLYLVEVLRVHQLLTESKQQMEFYKKYSPTNPTTDKRLGSLKKFARKFNGPGEQTEIQIDISSFMDFSDAEIDEELSFAGRIFIGADFQRANFRHRADFEDSIFFGLTHFDNANFLHDQRGQGPLSGISFRNTEFHNTAYFKETKFIFRTYFDCAEFHSAAYFNNCTFEPENSCHDPTNPKLASFEKCHFHKTVEFTGAKFDLARFEYSRFNDSVRFDDTKFSIAIFSNAKFRNTTSFTRTVFGHPPKFFQTELYEDTNFDDVDWRSAEKSYIQPLRYRNKSKSELRKSAANAVRTWDRLALIMSQREKHAERHVFFRLKMRAQRKRDGFGFLSLANLVFDISSDYGWSVVRAFGWWFFHIVFGMACFMLLGLSANSGLNMWLQLIQDSFCLSFANAHGILGLASIGGYLHECRIDLYTRSQSGSYMNVVSAIQVFCGPIFLFLVLLTLRNRFRIR